MKTQYIFKTGDVSLQQMKKAKPLINLIFGDFKCTYLCCLWMNFKNSKFLLGSLMPSSFITTGFRVIGPQERKIRQTAYTRKDQFNVNCNSAIFERKFYKIEIPILPKVLEWAQIYSIKCQFAQLKKYKKCVVSLPPYLCHRFLEGILNFNKSSSLIYIYIGLLLVKCPCIWYKLISTKIIRIRDPWF